ncbi:MAG: hypothetical protein HYT12_01790 [Candidatus Liptonbacteria bacterium]|nr:hypothetical protein [Candidatus Liptonbacteria bacterium]
MRDCFHCNGRGWVLNGDTEDGRESGRDCCPACKGLRKVTAEQVLQEIANILSPTTSTSASRFSTECLAGSASLLRDAAE